MSVNLKVRANPTRTYPQRGDNVNFGTQATLWAQDVTAEVNAIGQQFDWVLGSAAEVTAGTANFSDLATLVADATVLDGDSVLVLTNTYAVPATIDINKRLTIICQSTDCIFESTAALAAGPVLTFSADGTVFSGGSIDVTAGGDYCFELDADRLFIITASLGGYGIAPVQFTSGRATSMFQVTDTYCSNIESRWGFGTNAAQAIMRFFGSDGDGTGGDDSAGIRSNNGVIQFKDRGGNWTGFAAVVGANTALSNLGATAVNDAIIPDVDSTRDLGANLIRWANLYCDNFEGDTVVADTSVDAGNIQVSANQIISTNVNGNISLTPNGTGGVILNETTEVAITAHAGGGAGAAYALTAGFSVIVTCATAADSVILPATFPTGRRMTVRNDGAERADIFPATGDTINGMAADTAIQLLPGQTMEFIASVANSAWRVF